MKNVLLLLILTSGMLHIISCQTTESQINKNLTNENQINKNQNNTQVPSDKERFISTVQSLEENPFAETAKQNRSWALKYSEDIKYPTCETIFKLFLAKDVRGEVLTQFLIKLAAYELENSGKKYNTIDSHTVALASATNVYEKILKNDPSAKYGYFDALVDIRNKNQLSESLKDANCK
ncbi:MAG TPA: hypothetical protein PKE69_02190 [Pyrinomonadaceae bacterium]|nr:hypothetical protein [Pyrinomonadaceae bacterium]